MDATTFLASEFTLTPPVPNMTIGTDPADPSKITIFGDYSPNTPYTFSLHANATIDDCPGAEDQFGGACVPSAGGAGTYTNATVQGIMFKTAPIALTATSPADNAVVTKATAASTTKIKFTFNQDMLPASLDTTEWTLSPAVPMVVASAPSVDYAGNPIVLRNVVQLSGALPAGSYTFTLKGSATFLDVLTPANSFTPGTDKVIHFTVEDPPPPPPTPPSCL
jgi:hypothetical protein